MPSSQPVILGVCVRNTVSEREREEVRESVCEFAVFSFSSLLFIRTVSLFSKKRKALESC